MQPHPISTYQICIYSRPKNQFPYEKKNLNSPSQGGADFWENDETQINDQLILIADKNNGGIAALQTMASGTRILAELHLCLWFVISYCSVQPAVKSASVRGDNWQTMSVPLILKNIRNIPQISKQCKSGPLPFGSLHFWGPAVSLPFLCKVSICTKSWFVFFWARIVADFCFDWWMVCAEWNDQFKAWADGNGMEWMWEGEK